MCALKMASHLSDVTGVAFLFDLQVGLWCGSGYYDVPIYSIDHWDIQGITVFRLAYVSKFKFSTKDNTYTREIASVLMRSRRNNTILDITGAIIFAGNDCVQILEGKKGDIDFLIEKIFRDERHSDFEILYKEDAPHRVFPEFRMRLYTQKTPSYQTALAALVENDPLFKKAASENPRLQFLPTGIGIDYVSWSTSSIEQEASSEEDIARKELDYEGKHLSISGWPKASKMVADAEFIGLISSLSGTGVDFKELKTKGLFGSETMLIRTLDELRFQGLLNVVSSVSEVEAEAVSEFTPPAPKRFSSVLRSFLFGMSSKQG